MENLKNLILGNRILRRNGREVREKKAMELEMFKQQIMADRRDNYVIKVIPYLGMNEKFYLSRQPMDTAFQARLIAGALIAQKRYAQVTICRFSRATNSYVPLKIQPPQQ